MYIKTNNMLTNFFTCPRCGKQENTKDAEVLSVVTSSDVDMSRGYNPYMTKIVTKYYNVRFCKSCSKRLNINHYLRHILWYLLPVLIVNLFAKQIDFSSIAFPLGISLFFHPLAITLYRDIKMKIPYTKNLIKRAKQGNAITY